MIVKRKRGDLSYPPVERKGSGELYSLNPSQRRRVQALLRQCCNYDNGLCLMIGSPCVQGFSGSLCCRWFRWAVLEAPENGVLKAEILQDGEAVKKCIVCGKPFVPKSNRATYCRACAKKVRHKKEADRQKALRQGVSRTHLET